MWFVALAVWLYAPSEKVKSVLQQNQKIDWLCLKKWQLKSSTSKKMRARMNVIHEAGLFQGHLGFTRAIVLLEEGCEEFSNIHGLGQIRFPKNNIKDCFEEVRRVLEREEVISK